MLLLNLAASAFRFLETDDPYELADIWRGTAQADKALEILPRQGELLMRDAARGDEGTYASGKAVRHAPRESRRMQRNPR